MTETIARPGSERRRGRRKSSFRPDIQGLRAVAVLLVVASHAGIPGVSGGFVGVDVFFVISGFLITGLLVREGRKGQGISLTNFYARRARRILPAASLVLLATVAGSVLFLGSVRASEVGRDAVWSAFFAINWKFSNEGTSYFASTLPPSPLQHFWSLAVEEQFYLVWPLLFSLVLGLFARRARKKRRARRRLQARSGGITDTRSRRSKLLTSNRQLVLAGIIGLIGLASLTYSITYTTSSPDAAYFSAFTRVWELCVGALLAMLAPQVVKIPARMLPVVGWAGVVAIAAAAVLLGDETPFPGSAALLPVLGAAAVIVGGTARPTSGAGALLSVKPMRWIGDRSYSLYLWHWPFLVIAAAYVGHDLTIVQSLVMVGLALLATMATYSYLEYPIHKGKLEATKLASLTLWPVSFALIALVGLVAVDAAKTVPVFAGPGFTFGSALPPVAVGEPEEGGGTDDGAAGNEQGEVPAPGSIEEAVALAVSAGRAGAPVPSGLTPPLDRVRVEDSWETVTPCRAEVGQVTTDICPLGDPDGDRTMVIMGDSHAGMWVQALSDAAGEAGWTLYYFVKGGCPAADIIPTASGRDSQTETCGAWQDWAKAEIESLQPDLVVLASRGDKPLLGDQGETLEAGTPEHAQAWEDAYASTVSELAPSAGRVVVFNESPVMRNDPVTCLGGLRADLGECMTPRSASADTTGAAARAGAEAGGGEFLDVNRYLCADGSCPEVIQGFVVYSDGQHLTTSFSAALAPTLVVDLGLS